LSDSSPTEPYGKGQIVIVKGGDTVERLARRIYGRVDDGILALVQKHNPSIRNLNFILPGQELVFPPLE
jgi:phage tail protein X